MLFQTIAAAACAKDGPDLAVGVVVHDFSAGGSERIAIRLANRWEEMGQRVTVFCGSSQGPLRSMLGDRVAMLEPRSPISRGPGSRQRLGRAAAEAFAISRPDVLFVPGNFHWPAIAPVVARLGRRTPPIVAQISSALRRPGRGPLRQALFDNRFRRTMSHVAAAVALDDHAAREANAILSRLVTITLPLPALDDDVAPPTPFGRHGRTILAAGRFVPQKNFDLAVRAFAMLPDREARLVILGDGPLRADLERTAHRLGVADRVHMPGWTPDIRPWLDGARLFLLSSDYEGYPAVIVEALAAGRPVITTDCTPAADELIRGKGRGAVTPRGDAAALAKALSAELSSAPPDPAALAEAVQAHRLDPVAKGYLALFDQLAQVRI